MIPLDWTMCAMRRPDVVLRTLLSFQQNLIGVNMGASRLFINVDPMPDDRMSEEVIAVCQGFFGEVVSTCPQTPSFPGAVKRLFIQPETAWAFHCEDDWIMTQAVHIDDMLAQPGRVINLRAHNFREGITRCFLSPGLWDSSLMVEVGEKMNDHENPEVQVWRLTDHLRCGCYYGSKPLVRDIGREWLKESGYRKNVEVERGINPWTVWTARTA